MVKGKRLPTIDPAAFAPGDVLVIDGKEYTVQQNQYGEHRVMVTNPGFIPDGDEPRFVSLEYSDLKKAKRK